MIKKLLADHRCFHSEFQMDNFITIKQGTVYAQYKQALRELYKRIRGLRESKCDREKLLVEIEEQKHLSQKGFDKFKRKYADIEYKRKSMQLEECDRVIVDTEREFKRFYEQACALKLQVGELTEESVNQLEEEMYIFKVKEMMVSDWLCIGRYSPQTHELLNSLPLPTRIKLIEEIADPDKQKQLIEQHTTEDRNYFDNINKLEMDVQKCLSDL